MRCSLILLQINTITNMRQKQSMPTNSNKSPESFLPNAYYTDGSVKSDTFWREVHQKKKEEEKKKRKKTSLRSWKWMQHQWKDQK